MGAGSPTTILVVDDQRPVRALVKSVLEKHGYAILEAVSGEQALELLTQGPSDVALVITDIVMPGMSGVDLATRLQQLNPTLPVLLMTGFTDEDAEALQQFACIRKPFQPGELVRRVAELLEPGRPSS
jgi:two-component system, cell cycle sensor histidine kinase and response regulator CckA